MPLSKTDFIHYLNCPKSFWLSKRDPANFPAGEFSAFQQKLAQEGREVEQYFRQYFEERGNGNVLFERAFETDDGLYARLDGLDGGPEGGTTLYEVKSSTSVKAGAPQYQLKDACFQKICAERAGQPINRVFLVHLNGNYVRRGEIAPADLLVFKDVTDDVAEIEAETAGEIADALELLDRDIDREGCSCRSKSRGNHCDAFDHLNPDIPRRSIYSLPRFYGRRLEGLVEQGIFRVEDVPADLDLNAQQRMVLEALRTGECQIDEGVIGQFLEQLEYPLYFLDYETYASAVPIIDGASPHKHFPVQYSLHVLGENDELRHCEHLEREARLPNNLIEQLERDVDPGGSIVSWHAAFERTQNTAMAEACPDKADFLNDINARMVDLEDPFKTGYVDARFDGSTSIKKVLPVVCPDLNYQGLEVQDGAAAMEAWKQMIAAEPAEADRTARDLLRYCKLDTYAMVAIYRFLRDLRL
ncbi:MAG: DUF2779 domain-containing protein [Roseovarius sp.]